jgi:MFS transporter, ACS family, D-galactonate transporter
VSLVGVGLFAAAATHPHTAYDTFGAYFILMAAGGDITYVAWMSGFTETVEHRNPAATATGLAVWGWILRIVVTVSFAVLALVDQGPRVKQIAQRYPQQVRVLGRVSPATLAALSRNAADAAAQASAVSQLTGLSTAEIARVAALGARYREQLATASTIDPATQETLLTNPAAAAALRRAVGEVARAFRLSAPAALHRLEALAAVPRDQLLFLARAAPKVRAASAQLRSLSRIPSTDTAYLQRYGTKVAKAQRDNPGQWQACWWVCFGAQVLFLPFVLLLYGRWSPRRARREEEEHNRFVEREMRRLQLERAARA